MGFEHMCRGWAIGTTGWKRAVAREYAGAASPARVACFGLTPSDWSPSDWSPDVPLSQAEDDSSKQIAPPTLDLNRREDFAEQQHGSRRIGLVTLDVTNGARQSINMITSFACKHTETIFNDRQSPEFPSTIQITARRKLIQIHLAQKLSDLRIPPGNRLEALKGDRRGQHSVRVNDQWRICFRWTSSGVEDVEIVDYH
jgi:proteic killer suppression protein